MNIRFAKIDDITAIVDIYNQAIAAGHKTADITPVVVHDRVKWFQEHTPDKYPIFVATTNDTVVGYLTISAYRPGRMALSHTAEVSFYIHFKHHRQGIASRLLQYAIDVCPSLQITTLIAILLEGNQGSISLLEKFGFKEWGYMPQIADFNGLQVGHLYYGLRIGKC